MQEVMVVKGVGRGEVRVVGVQEEEKRFPHSKLEEKSGTQRA